MDIFSKNDLEILMRAKPEKCVSIYMPTRSAGRNTQQNHIRFKNLLREAEEKLTTSGMPVSDSRQMLAPAHRFVQNLLFWQFQSEGLAVFISPSMFRYYRLPLQFGELVIINSLFHIKPILPLFMSEGTFFVLCLSKHNTRFLQGTPYSISEIETALVPRSIEAAFRYTVYEPHGRFHAAPRNKMYKGPVIYHGQSDTSEDAKGELFRYFRMINRGLHDILLHERSPMVLAGVEYHIPIYRSANSYPHLLDNAITGNTDRMHSEEIALRARSIVKPYFEKSRTQAFDRYAYLHGTGSALASNSLADIIGYSRGGRVDTLFTPAGVQSWGSVDPASNTVRFHEKPEAGDGDLVDLAAIHTLMHGGTVYPIEPQKIPEQGKAAAILRY